MNSKLALILGERIRRENYVRGLTKCSGIDKKNCSGTTKKKTTHTFDIEGMVGGKKR